MGNSVGKFYGEESRVWNCMKDYKIEFKLMYQLQQLLFFLPRYQYKMLRQKIIDFFSYRTAFAYTTTVYSYSTNSPFLVAHLNTLSILTKVIMALFDYHVSFVLGV